MKKLLFAIITVTLMASCSKNDNPIAIEPINEQEVITTVKLVLTPENGGATVTLQSKDLDDDGPLAPVTTPNAAVLEQNKTYNGVLYVLNELVSPIKNITADILNEAVDHQFFYQTTGSLPMFNYSPLILEPSNYDLNGKPLGLKTQFVTLTSATGTLKITLRHQGDKSKPNVANGDITNATGETDFEVNFPNISVQ